MIKGSIITETKLAPTRRELLQKHLEMGSSLKRMKKDLYEIKLFCYGRKPKTSNDRAVLRNCVKALAAVDQMRSHLENCMTAKNEDNFSFQHILQVYYGEFPPEEVEAIMLEISK
jgi:hypothetical protein